MVTVVMKEFDELACVRSDDSEVSSLITISEALSCYNLQVS